VKQASSGRKREREMCNFTNKQLKEKKIYGIDWEGERFWLSVLPTSRVYIGKDRVRVSIIINL
jgi:hypothetical protein